MKIVLTCGHPHSGYPMAHAALAAAGLAPARPLRRESMSSAQWHEAVCKANSLNPSAPAQLSPGKVWQDLAVDLFLGNLDEAAWGFADARAVWLLDFWRDFDPQICFVLVYSSLEWAAGQALVDPACDIGAVAASWTACNAEILRFYHRNPGRCLLVEVSSLIEDPRRFAERAAAAFGLEIPGLLAGYRPEWAGSAAVASCLAKPLVEAFAEAAPLYQDMESSADLAASALAEGRQAWQEYARLLADLGQAREEAIRRAAELAQARAGWDAEAGRQADAHQAALRDWQARLEQAALAHSEQARLAAAAQSALNAEIAGLQSIQAEVAEENKLLSVQIHCVQDELEDQRQKLEGQCEQAKQELEARLEQAQLAAAEQQTQSERLAGERDEQARLAAERQRALDAKLAEAAKPQPGPSADLVRENEVLLLQLHQVQEELENYFLKYQEAAQGLAARAAPPRNRPSEQVFDFRGDIDGGNWYYAEHDGRWAGPEDLSSFEVEPLRGGEYELQLDVVDAMEPEILLGMEVTFNGTPVAVETGWERSDRLQSRLRKILRRVLFLRKARRKHYPVLVQGRFVAEENAPAWEFHFKFPKLVSPADRGSDDHRRLAIRLRSLKLRAVG